MINFVEKQIFKEENTVLSPISGMLWLEYKNKGSQLRAFVEYPEPVSYRAEKITEKKVREYISVY